MRAITVKAPEGKGKSVAEVAFSSGATQISVWQERQYTPDHRELVLDVVEIESPLPQAKQFVRNLVEAPFYDHKLFAFSIKHLEPLPAADRAKVETHPVRLPNDAYVEMWQFTRFTSHLVGRAFLSGVLLAYGMVENLLVLAVVGLLFLPYYHQMLAVGLGAATKEWQLVSHGLLSLLITTALTVLAAVCVALLIEPSTNWHELSSLLLGLVLASIVGVVAGLSAVDDDRIKRLIRLPGRREFIGLAVATLVAVYPAWFGLKFIFGFNEGDKWAEHLLSFCINASFLMFSIGVTYRVKSTKGKAAKHITR